MNPNCKRWAQEMFMVDAMAFAAINRHFNPYKAWDQVCEDKGLMNALDMCRNPLDVSIVVKDMVYCYVK